MIDRDELFNDDVIFAPATNYTNNAALAIIRLSGAGVFDIADKVIKSKILPSKSKSWKMQMGNLIDSDGNVLDKILFTTYHAPNSYTGDNMLELFVHGGEIIIESIMELLEKHGARIARNGEFTQRAFINGKMDLIEAEAIDNIIKANNRSALIATERVLENNELANLKEIAKKLEKLRIELVANLEFPDDVDDNLPVNALEKAICDLKNISNDLLIRSERSSLLSKGIDVVLYGFPNAGKSSIFNAIIKENRAIVHHKPGTTRDYLDNRIRYKGTSFILYDTAGFNLDAKSVEKDGIERTRKLVEKAEIIVLVIDSTDKTYRIPGFDSGKSIIYVLNKIDLPSSCIHNNLDFDFIPTSAIDNLGINKLLDRIKEIIDNKSHEDELILSSRNREHLNSLHQSAENGLKAISDGLYDVLCVQIENAIETLNRMFGQEFTKDVLDDIFASFCIGK
ncbi:MAG: tRNA uridine-5-carboxymethylaminomethyl(34) synthesis GTPase MnmE [Candidatus Zixiibacteriota bacterium]